MLTDFMVCVWVKSQQVWIFGYEHMDSTLLISNVTSYQSNLCYLLKKILKKVVFIL